MTKKIYKDNAEACRAYRERIKERKRQRIQELINQGKLCDPVTLDEAEAQDKLEKQQQEEKEEDAQFRKDLDLPKEESTVSDIVPDYNYHCPCGKECKSAGYECKLEEKYQTCKYFRSKFPPPPTPKIFYDDSDNKPYGFRDPWGGPVNGNSYRK